jgi:tRNA(Arg) A34 adenosine deaminase TadA
MEVNEQFIRQTIQLAEQARQCGNDPFGVLLAVDGQVVLTAENTVNSEGNPTRHVEINLVQKAIREMTKEQIAKATLYASCEPCAMCAGAIYWTGIRKVVYALPTEELAKIAGGSLIISCREIFGRAQDRVQVAGPFLVEEARRVHEGFWI